MFPKIAIWQNTSWDTVWFGACVDGIALAFIILKQLHWRYTLHLIHFQDIPIVRSFMEHIDSIQYNTYVFKYNSQSQCLMYLINLYNVLLWFWWFSIWFIFTISFFKHFVFLDMMEYMTCIIIVLPYLSQDIECVLGWSWDILFIAGHHMYLT